LAKLLDKIIEVFFPKNFTCDLCGTEVFDGTNLCNKCKPRVVLNDKLTCPVCGRRTFRQEICITCKAKAPNYKKGASAIVYDDGATVLIHKFKNGCVYLKDYFIPLLVEKCKSLPPCDVVLYVPMTKRSTKKRGYNQSKLLATGVAESLNLPLLDDVILKVKETNEQKSLSHREREENLKGCFKIVNPDKIKGKNVLLIDDVLTTGATMQTICSKLLKKKVSAVYCATVCSVEYKLRPNPVE